MGDLYEGALIPGLTLMGMYAAYVLMVSIFKPEAAPALPLEARTLKGRALAFRVLTCLIPPLVLIFWCSVPFSSVWPRPPKAAPWARAAPSSWR